MKKKRFIGIALLFFFLTSFESGILIEVLWHGWGGFGDISLEYTEKGTNGISFLLFFIPVSVIAIFLVRLALCIKEKNNRKALLMDCLYALTGIGIGIGLCYIAPFLVDMNPVFHMGGNMTSFLIDLFDWMTIPAAG